MQGQPLVPLQLAEESLSNKLKELSEDFVNLVFSGIAIQEIKKRFTEKDIINRFTWLSCVPWPATIML